MPLLFSSHINAFFIDSFTSVFNFNGLKVFICPSFPLFFTYFSILLICWKRYFTWIDVKTLQRLLECKLLLGEESFHVFTITGIDNGCFKACLLLLVLSLFENTHDICRCGWHVERVKVFSLFDWTVGSWQRSFSLLSAKINPFYLTVITSCKNTASNVLSFNVVHLSINNYYKISC